MTPINVNPGISFGFTPWSWWGRPFNFSNFSDNWFSDYWFAWISDWGAYGPCFGGLMRNAWWWAWQDADGDGIPNTLDPYPYWNEVNGNILPPASDPHSYHNVYAGLNLHNFVNLADGRKNLVIPEEGARLHPDFVNMFVRNKQADEYRQKAIATREQITKNYQTNPANTAKKGGMIMPSLENIAKSIGISSEQMSRIYNNPHVRTPGMMYERGSGLVNRGSMSSGAERGGESGSYAIPSAGSATASSVSSAERKGEASETAKGGTIKTEKK
jgi:hypothetical protein